MVWICFCVFAFILDDFFCFYRTIRFVLAFCLFVGKIDIGTVLSLQYFSTCNCIIGMEIMCVEQGLYIYMIWNARFFLVNVGDDDFFSFFHVSCWYSHKIPNKCQACIWRKKKSLSAYCTSIRMFAATFRKFQMR